jgi:hypothetical protein
VCFMDSHGPFAHESASLPSWEEARTTAPPTGNERLHEHAELLWGPIGQEDANMAGSAMPTSSVALRIHLPESLRRAVLEQIPVEVLPVENDTAASLAQRLGTSKFLEDIHVLKGGCGPQRVRLNATCYPQPRRRSWSVLISPEYLDEDGDLVSQLYMYTAYGRLAHDWEAVPMPRPIYDLGVALWRICFPLLGEVSRKHPPTGCQLLLYYTSFDSHMGRHRDNYRGDQMADVLSGATIVDCLNQGNPHGGDANSQAIGSHVLVYTEGNADMTFALAFAPRGNSRAGLSHYIIHPIFCTTLGAGTVLVFSPADDLFFSHEAWFLDPTQGTHRLAFVFRWLTLARTFYKATGKLKLSSDMETKADARTKRKARAQAEDRRKALRRI